MKISNSINTISAHPELASIVLRNLNAAGVREVAAAFGVEPEKREHRERVTQKIIRALSLPERMESQQAFADRNPNVIPVSPDKFRLMAMEAK